MTLPRQIRRADLERFLQQWKELREILEAWPARSILMEYEKEWNERRLQALRTQQEPDWQGQR